MEASIFLQQVLHPVGPHSEVSTSIEVICFGQATIPSHDVEMSKTSSLKTNLDIGLYS